MYICSYILVRSYCFPLMPAVFCRDLFGSSNDDSVLKSLQKEGLTLTLWAFTFLSMSKEEPLIGINRHMENVCTASWWSPQAPDMDWALNPQDSQSTKARVGEGHECYDYDTPGWPPLAIVKLLGSRVQSSGYTDSGIRGSGELRLTEGQKLG